MPERNSMKWHHYFGHLFDAVETAYQAGLRGEGGFPWAVDINVRLNLRELKRLGCTYTDLEEGAMRRQYENINAAYYAGLAERKKRTAA